MRQNIFFDISTKDTLSSYTFITVTFAEQGMCTTVTLRRCFSVASCEFHDLVKPIVQSVNVESAVPSTLSSRRRFVCCLDEMFLFCATYAPNLFRRI